MYDLLKLAMSKLNMADDMLLTEWDLVIRQEVPAVRNLAHVFTEKAH